MVRCRLIFGINTSIFEKRKQSPYKPGPVPHTQGGASAIYLLRRLPYGSSILPSIVFRRIRTDSPQPMVYANLQPPDGTARRSPAGWWSLTPPSHPYPRMGGYFLLPYPTVTNSWHFHQWSVLCCPDFPLVPQWTPATDRGSAFSVQRYKKILNINPIS